MDRIAAHIVKLDSPDGAYGVCSQSGSEDLSWVVFAGPDAGRRAWAYADANFDDVKSARPAPARSARVPSLTAFGRKAG